MIPIDIKNKKFNQIKVLYYDVTSIAKGHAYWICRCSCGKKFSVRGSHLRNNQTKSCGCIGAKKAKIFLTKYANSIKHKKEGNPMWKGSKAGIGSIHRWLDRNFIKIKKCEHCNLIKKIDWALKKNKKYEHNRKNFICLCRSCHLKYDYTQERKDKMSKILKKTWNKRKNNG